MSTSTCKCQCIPAYTLSFEMQITFPVFSFPCVCISFVRFWFLKDTLTPAHSFYSLLLSVSLNYNFLYCFFSLRFFLNVGRMLPLIKSSFHSYFRICKPSEIEFIFSLSHFFSFSLRATFSFALDYWLLLFFPLFVASQIHPFLFQSIYLSLYPLPFKNIFAFSQMHTLHTSTQTKKSHHDKKHEMNECGSNFVVWRPMGK